MGDFRSVLKWYAGMLAALSLPVVSGASPTQADISDKYKVVHNFMDTWRFYSRAQEAMLPYIPENDIKTNTIYFRVDPKLYPGEDLLIAMPQGASLWIHNRVIQRYAQRDTLVLPMDSLAMQYGDNPLDIAVYHPDRPVEGLLTFAGKQHAGPMDGFDVYPLSPRHLQTDRDGLIVIGLLLVAYFTVLLNLYPKNARLLFNISFVLSGSTSVEETFNPRTITRPQFLFMLALSGVMSFLVIVYHREMGIERLTEWMEDTPLSLSWGTLLFVFFLAINAKYVLIALMNRLFGIEDQASGYFFDILILSMVFFSCLFLLISAAGLAFPHKLAPMLQGMVYAVMAYYFLRIFLLFLKIRNKTPVKNLHLFSYLCTTELLPAIVGIKYFLD